MEFALTVQIDIGLLDERYGAGVIRAMQNAGKVVADEDQTQHRV